MIHPLRFLARLRGNSGHHGSAMIRNRGQQYSNEKQRAQAYDEFRNQLRQDTSGEHGFSRFKRDAQIVHSHNTNALHEMFLPIFSPVPQLNCPAVQAIPPLRRGPAPFTLSFEGLDPISARCIRLCHPNAAHPSPSVIPSEAARFFLPRRIVARRVAEREVCAPCALPGPRDPSTAFPVCAQLLFMRRPTAYPRVPAAPNLLVLN